MIDEKPIRTRYQAVRRSLAWSAVARGGGSPHRRARRCGRDIASDQGCTQYHRARHQGPEGARFIGREGAPKRRRPAGDNYQGSDIARRSAAVARTGDDGRSDAPAAVGFKKPREASDRAWRDGPQGECVEYTEAVGAVGLPPPREPQDEGREQPS